MGLKIYTGGTFDLLHAGHVELLRKCKELGEVTVALNTDDFIENYKGKPPVMTYQEREAVLLACRYVDRVIPNHGGLDSKPSILAVKPDLIVIGSDWAKKDYYKQMQFTTDWLDQHGIGLAYVPYSWGISSTEIKRRIAVD
jgi:glycerol-3-phosphate cytidylyltransferase